jgi:hypothetical protein
LINEFEENMKVMGDKTAKQHIETKQMFRKIAKKLDGKMESPVTAPSVSSSKPSVSSSKPPVSSSKPSAKTPEENMQKEPSPSPKQSNKKSQKPSRPASYLQQPKVLLVGDSVAHNANFRERNKDKDKKH